MYELLLSILTDTLHHAVDHDFCVTLETVQANIEVMQVLLVNSVTKGTMIDAVLNRHTCRALITAPDTAARAQPFITRLHTHNTRPDPRAQENQDLGRARIGLTNILMRKPHGRCPGCRLHHLIMAH
jgi:hypothetical protein